MDEKYERVILLNIESLILFLFYLRLALPKIPAKVVVKLAIVSSPSTSPDGAPFFSFSPFFSTSTLLAVLLAVLTSESTLLASESEQLEVGRRNNGTKWRDKRMWNYSQLAIKRCRQQSPAVHISCPAQKSSQGGLGRFKC